MIINGGIRDFHQVREHLGEVDGVMIGREAYQNPYFLIDADRIVFDDPHPQTDRHGIAEAFMPYLAKRFAEGHHPKHALRHILNLFQAVPGARAFRRHLSENMHRPDTTPQILMDALALVPRPSLIEEV